MVNRSQVRIICCFYCSYFSFSLTQNEAEEVCGEVLCKVQERGRRVPEDGPEAADGVEAHVQVDEQANVLRRDGTSQRVDVRFRIESINIYKEQKTAVSLWMDHRLPMVWSPTYRQMNRSTYFVEIAPAREQTLGLYQRVLMFIKSRMPNIAHMNGSMRYGCSSRLQYIRANISSGNTVSSP